jgi:hypothetical protein
VLHPLVAALDAEDESADRLLGKVSDDVWNAVCRPANDPALNILFPGGIAYYADGSNEEQPERMELLAELLEAGIHPKLDPQLANQSAKKVREAAKSYRAKVEAVRAPRTRVALLQRVETALGRTAQVAFANLKRAWLATGITEVEIHKVIPDRGRSGGKSEPEAPAAPQQPK